MLASAIFSFVLFLKCNQLTSSLFHVDKNSIEGENIRLSYIGYEVFINSTDILQEDKQPVAQYNHESQLIVLLNRELSKKFSFLVLSTRVVFLQKSPMNFCQGFWMTNACLLVFITSASSSSGK